MTVLAWFACATACAALLVAVINAVFWPIVKAARDNSRISLSVLIPARNEEDRLAPCLESVLAQGQAVMEALVYNDHSDDGTAGVIERYAGMDSRVRGVLPHPLPTGWCGKNFACFRLAHEARGEWLLFLDADARLAPDAAAAAVHAARASDATMLSLWPRIEMCGFWERSLMPMLNFVVFASCPAPLGLWSNHPALGLAHGACILVRRDTYMRLGGHERVRNEIFEDTQLARFWRASSERAICLDGRYLVSVRMYTSFAEIWRGFQKNFYPAFRSPLVFSVFLVVHFLAFLFPFAAVFVTATTWPWWLMATVCVLTARGVLALRFKQAMWTALIHPLAETLLIALGISSWWRCATRRGLEWKGRFYRSATQEEVLR